MINLTTPQEASKGLSCPLSRTFGDDDLNASCRGAGCAVWRWTPVPASDPRFMNAVGAEVDRLHAAHMEANPISDRKKNGFHQAAVKNVMADPKAHGVPDKPERGYCGLGGEPKA